MSNSTEDIFLLVHNTDQIPKDSEVVFKYIDTDYIESLEPISELQYSTVFYSFATPFDSIDYPISYYGTEIISSRALNVINSNYGENQMELQNITVINTNLYAEDPRRELERDDEIIIESIRNKEYYSKDFYLMYPPIIENLLDMEKSEYKKYTDGTIGIIHEYVLSDKIADVPPIFTIKEDLGAIFITSKLRKLWQDLGVTGTAYLPLDKPFGIPDVDVPIKKQ